MPERQPDMLDVGEGFPPLPVKCFANVDQRCPPGERCLVLVHVPERCECPDPADPAGKRKIKVWRYTVWSHFYGATPAEAMGKANRFMREQFRKEAARAGAAAARAKGRKRQAARRRKEAAE